MQLATTFTLKYYGKRMKIRRKKLHDFILYCGFRQGGVISMPFYVSFIYDSRN